MKVQYFEFEDKCGESLQGKLISGLFQVNAIIIIAYESEFKIDGGTDPFKRDRFCLGSIGNKNQNEKVKKALSYITTGITLLNNEDGTIGKRSIVDITGKWLANLLSFKK